MPFCIYIPGPNEVLIQHNKEATSAYIPRSQECCKNKAGKVLNWLGDEICYIAQIEAATLCAALITVF